MLPNVVFLFESIIQYNENDLNSKILIWFISFIKKYGNIGTYSIMAKSWLFSTTSIPQPMDPRITKCLNTKFRKWLPSCKL